MGTPAPSASHSQLYLLLHQLYLLNSQEADLKAQRIAQEELVSEQIAALYGAPPKDAAKTYTIDDYKVTVTNKTNFTPADKDSLHLLQTLAPESVVTKLELYGTYLKNLRNDAPDLYLKLTPYIVSKSAKTNIKIVSTSQE